MLKKKLTIFLLSFLLLCSTILSPISILASETIGTYEETSNEELILIKVVEDVEMEDLVIKKGAIMYALENANDESIYHIPLYIQEDVLNLEISKNSIEFVSDETDYLPIQPSDLDSINFQTFESGDVFKDIHENIVIEVKNEAIKLPIISLDNNQWFFIGHSLVQFENDETATEIEHPSDEPVKEDSEGDEKIESDFENEDISDSQDVEKSEELKETDEESLNDNFKEEIEETKKEVEQEETTATSFIQRSTFQVLSTPTKVNPWASSNAKYFEVTEENLSVYDNRSGSLVEIGKLKKGQTYPIVSDYGNWHRIQFGSYFGYVLKSSTTPSSQNAIKNENKSFKNQQRSITSLVDTPVYDNTSGSLVEFGTILKGTTISIVSDYGNWWRINYSGRVGYVSKSSVKANFLKGDTYFKVLYSNTPVYDNRTGKLVQVGSITKGQVYPIKQDYGNWWKIQFDKYTGYVHKSATEFSNSNLQNINKSYKHGNRTFTAKNNAIVYDNSRGSLKGFGIIKEGVTYHIAGDYGNWWRIIYADRVGYVYKPNVKANFLPGDKYFVAESNLPIYDNRSGSLVKVGELLAGENYPITSDYGNWWRIKFSNYNGYVLKSGTSAVTRPDYKNNRGNYRNSSKLVKTARNTTVYDNTSGNLVPIGEISADVVYPIVSNYGNWWRILFNDRVGYIHKNDTFDTMITQTTYNLSFNQALNIQMTATPKKDGAGNYAATRNEVSSYLNPANFKQGSSSFYQFLLLDQPTYSIASELNSKFLSTYSQAGSLQGQGAAFIEAANRYGINEVYLVAHTLHETGKGKSTLASGVSRWTQMVPGTCTPVKDKNGKNVIIDISPRKVYNMYGIHAFDNCPTNAGAQYAYDNGWFTPAAAIVGGAYYIKNGYIERGQNTLYKMRWDPESAARTGRYGKQYATHIAWADIQARSIARMYDQLTGYFLQYDIPQYSDQPPTNETSVNLYRVTTSSSGLNARSTPGGTVVVSIPKDTIVSVLLNSNGRVVSQNADGLTWYQVSYNGQQLWVASNFLTKVD